MGRGGVGVTRVERGRRVEDTSPTSPVSSPVPPTSRRRTEATVDVLQPPSSPDVVEASLRRVRGHLPGLGGRIPTHFPDSVCPPRTEH